MGTSNLIVRAFELVRIGECESIADIKQRLIVERFATVEDHFESCALRRLLAEALDAHAKTGTSSNSRR